MDVSTVADRRHFPLPWTAELQAGCYVVRDAIGQIVSWHYFRDDPNTARQAKVLTRDEARRIAVNFAKLPGLLTQQVGRARRA